MISVCEPVLDGNETKYVLDCLQTNWISSNGPYNRRFEESLAAYIGVEHAVTCSSCTTALHLALVTLGIGPGDEVLIPDFTLIVSANTVIQSGATPVLVDVDPLTWCIDPTRIEEKINEHTRAIMVVHMYGHPCDMPAILQIARLHSLKVIEDCAEAHGAEIAGRKVGSFGDIACFSFYGNKIITTGEGGMLVTRDAELAERAALLRNQGFQTPRFVHEVSGFNYRMTNVQAAIGLAQMEKVEQKVTRKRWIGHTYTQLLSGHPNLALPIEASGAVNVYWMFGVVFKGIDLKKETMMERLQQKGVETRAFFCPMHMQPVFHRRGAIPHSSFEQQYPVSENLWTYGLYLPSGLSLDQAQIEFVCQALRQSIKEG
jgi:perosamine synthetase